MKFEFKPSPRPADVSESNWMDWGWQMRQSLKSQLDFEQTLTLSNEEKVAFQGGSQIFNVRATPYALSLLGASDADPLRKILIPNQNELKDGTQAMLDPLNERNNNPVPRVIHRYPDRALFLLTDFCSVYCRYCTRKHFTGQEQAFAKKDEYARALKYFREQTGLREVILSGGDPLTLADSALERVISDLRAIEHIEIIRIGTRMPVVCPMRVTSDLVQMLRKYKPVYLMTHFNHPREITREAADALERFVDHGVPVYNQMVLLNGINNHPTIVQALSRRLLYLRVKPYYMFQCDPSQGTDHLRTSVEESMQIQRELWGTLSGLAMPILSLDIPGGGGKTSLVPDFEVEHNQTSRTFVGWDGVRAQYHNPDPQQSIQPSDWTDYQGEWEKTKNAKLRLQPETIDTLEA